MGRVVSVCRNKGFVVVTVVVDGVRIMRQSANINNVEELRALRDLLVAKGVNF